MEAYQDDTLIDLINLALEDGNCPLAPLRDYIQEKQYPGCQLSYLELSRNARLSHHHYEILHSRYWYEIRKLFNINIDSDQPAIPFSEFIQ